MQIILTFFADISFPFLAIKDRKESMAESDDDVATSQTQITRDERDETGQRASKYEGDEI